jgi:hypothetical protein
MPADRPHRRFMKTSLRFALPLLFAAVVPALHAAPRIAVEVKVTQSTAPRGFAWFKRSGGTDTLSLPPATVKSGKEVSFEVTRAFRVFNAVTRRGSDIPTGVTFSVTPAHKDGRIAYSGRFKVNQLARITPHDREPEHVIEFASNELVVGGNATSGKPVSFEVKHPADGRKLTLWMRLTASQG